MNRSNNKQTEQPLNNHLDEQFLTVLRETYPAEQKAQLRARLTQVTPEKRWWRHVTMDKKQDISGNRRQIVPRLAGVVALFLIAAVSFAILKNPSDTTVLVDSPDSTEEQPKEAIAKQQNTQNFKDAPEVANVFDISYRWAVDDEPVVPAEILSYVYAVDFPETEDEMEAFSEQTGVSDPTVYHHNWWATQSSTGNTSDIWAEFRGENNISMIFLPDPIRQMFYRDNTLFDNAIINATDILNDEMVPLADDVKIEGVQQFLAAHPIWGTADTVHIEPNGNIYAKYGQQFATFTPQLMVENIESPIPVYDQYRLPLSHVMLDESGRVVEILNTPVTFEPSGKTATIKPPLEALTIKVRHSSTHSWITHLLYNRSTISTLNKANDGDTITVKGRIDLILNTANGENSTVLYMPRQASIQMYSLQIPEHLQSELNDPSAIGPAEITGQLRLNDEGYVIAVTSWEKADPNSGCRDGRIGDDEANPTFIIDVEGIATYQSIFLPAGIGRGDSVTICTDDWSDPLLIEWDELKKIGWSNDKLSDDTVRVITSARLIYRMADIWNSYDNKLTLYWEFTGQNQDGESFTIHVRAE